MTCYLTVKHIMKKLVLALFVCAMAYGAQAQTKSKVYNCSRYGAKDGSIDLIMSGGKPPYTYKWSNGATTEDLAGLASGRYTVTVTDASVRGCQLEVSFDVAQPMSDNSNASALRSDVYTSRFDVYPNPTESSSNIVFYNSDKADFDVRVLNATGAVVFEENVKGKDGEYNHKMDFNGMAKGIYLVEIRSQKESITKQLIVQ